MSDDARACLAQFSRTFTPIKWTTPVDLHHHVAVLTERIASGNDRAAYPLVFRYPAVDVEAVDQAAYQVRARLGEVPDYLRTIVEAEIDGGREAAHVIAARNDQEVTAWAIRRYGQPSAATLTYAHSVANAQDGSPPHEPATFGAASIAGRLECALAAYGLTWHVRVDDNMTANASVVGTQNLVKVSSTALVTGREMDRLVCHEVGGHVLRWENARRQASPWASAVLGESVAAEEGLAALVEEELGVATEATTRTYALRVLGVSMLDTTTLDEMARFLANYLPPNEAARMALRLRRGLGNSSSPGGTTKDHAYLTGLMDARALAKSAPWALHLIRGTKWPFAMLDLATDLAEAHLLALPTMAPDGRLLRESASGPTQTSLDPRQRETIPPPTQ